MDEHLEAHELAGYTAGEWSQLTGEERLRALLAWDAAREEAMPESVEERARDLDRKRSYGG